MKKFNPSAWAIEHPQMVIYLMIVIMVAGAISYMRLGRDEDPFFTYKVMVVRTLWPGATAEETEKELTDRIEKKMQEVPGLDYLKSVTRPGESLIFVFIKETIPPKDVPATWYQTRKRLDDLRPSLPVGVQGPFANDDFGDVQMLIYGLTGDGYDMAELRREADRMAIELRTLTDVKKVELIGMQPEKIYLEIAPTRMSALGITPAQISAALQQQNRWVPAGFVETKDNRIRMRVSGNYQSVDAVRETPININGRSLRLGDVAEVSRGFADPPEPEMRVSGKPAVGIAVVMDKGGNVIGLGEAVGKRMQELQAQLPLGMDVHVVSNQPEFVRDSISVFVKTLFEAVVIVLAVTFISLGWRTGLVVALSIPLVLAMTFILMRHFDIDLQRISLGSLIIALGLLVDDAIIAVEMMVVKIEEGMDRFHAATFAYTSTAMPMLFGTLVTAAGFLPVALARSTTGEYCFSMFAVVTIALLSSWVVAVVFTPYLGYRLLDPVKLAARNKKKHQAHHGAPGSDQYATPFYRRFRQLVEWCVNYRWIVIATSVAGLGLAIFLFATVVERQFFPHSQSVIMLVDIYLPEGSSLKATEAETKKVEELLKDDANVAEYTSYVGIGAPRFNLALDQQLNADSFAQIIIRAKSVDQRVVLRDRLDKIFDNNPAFAQVRVRTSAIGSGPPVGFLVQYRVSGPDKEKLRGVAEQVAAVVRTHRELKDIHLDWNEKIKSIKVEIDQERARALGVSSQEVAQTLQTWLSGTAITQFREHDQLIDVVLRAPAQDRATLDRLAGLDLMTASGAHVPLSQVARLVPVLEEGAIWRRDRVPTISVRATMVDESVQAPTVSGKIWPELASIRAALPPGYRIVTGGEVEESDKGQITVGAELPVTILIILTLLMLQLQSMSRTAMVLLTAPLGMIGVPIGMIAFNTAMGFVANLGVIALMGMIMRNSIILIDQIRQDEDAGKNRFEAIVSSTVRRFRPVVLTAAASILAMVPLTRQVFWGPMAVAIMGGLLIATVLTCLFLPALYAAWYRVKKPSEKNGPVKIPNELLTEGLAP